MSGVIQKYDRTENLFDAKLLRNNQNLNPTSGLPYNYDGRIANTAGNLYSNVTTATLTFSVVGITTTEVKAIYSVFNDTTLVRRVSNVSNGDTLDLSNGNKLYICFYSNVDITTANISNLMLNTGSTAKPYQPYLAFKDVPYTRLETATDTITALPKTTYNDDTNATVAIKGNMQQSGTPTPSSPITPSECGERTENLFDLSVLAYPYDLDTSTGLPAYRPGSIIIRTVTTVPIDVTGLTQVTLTYSSTVTDTLFIYSIFNNDTLIERVANKSSGYTISLNGANKLYLCFYNTNNSVITDNLSDIMLNVGSTAKPYEPYGYKLPIVSGGVTTNVYLNEPLRKIGDYADTIAADGTVTRVIKKYEITGQEADWRSTGTKRMAVVIPNIPLANENNICVCTHYKGIYITQYSEIGDGECTISRGRSEWAVYDSQYNDIDVYKAYVQQQYTAGTPVTVWYVLETPTTETITAPSIPTTSGGQTFDVDTSLKPSEVDLTYHGWHEHQPEQYVNGAWT